MLINKRYLYYGGSIIISRGLEYFVLFFAAYYLTKNQYGELEYYKKFVEVGSSILAFGFPALILSYTRSSQSKYYFYLLSLIFVLVLGTALIVLGFIDPIWLLLIPALVFYATFFTGGIAQSFQIVQLGSNYASIYKIVISILFYGIVFIYILFSDSSGKGYLYPALFLLPLCLLFNFYEFKKINISRFKLRRYWKLFSRLLPNSLTLVVSNFANLMFLYTDIFVIKLFSNNANAEIADFSFALNVAGVLLIVSTTLIQVDIEKLKQNSSYYHVLNKRILALAILMSAGLTLAYYILINFGYQHYQQTFVLFFILMIGKLFASQANLYGTFLIIHRKFKLNLYVNSVFLLLNIGLCFMGYYLYGIIGLAISSAVMLAMRCLTFYFYSQKQLKES